MSHLDRAHEERGHLTSIVEHLGGELGEIRQKTIDAGQQRQTLLAREEARDGMLRQLLQETRLMKGTMQEFSQIQAAHDHNQGQIRLQLDQLGRRFEAIADDVLDRQATAPLFKELMRVCDELEALREESIAQRIQDRVWALRQELIHFMDAHGVQAVRPAVGADLDPKCHEAVNLKPNQSHSLTGKVARVQSTGLKNERRVIAPARVEVFGPAQPRLPNS